MSSVIGNRGDAASTDRIAIVMQAGRDRESLAEWVSTLPGYTVGVHSTPPDGDQPVDLYILDQDTLTEHRRAWELIKEASKPVFLPYLLLLPPNTATTTDQRSRQRLETGIVNDVAERPVAQVALARRIENLLSARRASLRLREQENQYEQLVELTPEAILLVDDGKIRYANSAAMELFRTAEGDDLRDRDLFDVVEGPGRATVRQVIDTVQAEGSLKEFVDIELTRPDETNAYAEISGVQVTLNRQPLTQLVIRDVTGEKRRRQRLDLFRRAIEVAAHGITIADVQQEDDPLIYANNAFERITGYSAAEIMGRNCRFLQGERTDPEAVSRFRRALKAREPVSVELLNYRKDGTPFWNRVDLVPVEGIEGTVTHYLGLQQDITEQKQRTERITVMDRVLRHNLRNRLNVIRGYAEQLPKDVTVDGEPIGDRILAAADNLIELSEQIRNFRSVVSGVDQERIQADIAETVTQIVAGLRRGSPDATIELVQTEPAMALVHPTLPAALETVLELATEPKGTTPNIRIEVAADTDRVTVSITDLAGTIPVEELHVLDDRMETPTDHPLGLEAWLVRWAVLASGGELVVEFEGERRLHLHLVADTGER